MWSVASKTARTPGKVPDLKDLLARQPNLAKQRDDTDLTLLHHAAAAGNVCAVQALLSCGADAAAVDEKGRTPLLMAVLEGPCFSQSTKEQEDSPATSVLGVVNALLSEGASLHACSAAGQSPLHVAAALGRRAVLARLIAAASGGGAELGVLDTQDGHGRTLLHLACLGRAGLSDGDGAAPCAGCAALPLSSSPPHTDLVLWLLRLGASPSTPDAEGSLPLHVAVRRGSPELVEALVAAFPPAVAAAAQGNTPMSILRSLCTSPQPALHRATLWLLWIRLSCVAALLPLAPPGSHWWAGATPPADGSGGGSGAGFIAPPHACAWTLIALLAGPLKSSAQDAATAPLLTPQLVAVLWRYLLGAPLSLTLLLLLRAGQWVNQYGAGLLWPVASVALWGVYEARILPWLGPASLMHWLFLGLWRVAWGAFLLASWADAGSLVPPQGMKASIMARCGLHGARDAPTLAAAAAAGLRHIRQGASDLPAAPAALAAVYTSHVSQGAGAGQVYCQTCGIARPWRSKHDRHSGACIARFDHWCPWTGNAVGEANYPVYLLFIVTATLLGFLWLLLCLAHLATQPLGGWGDTAWFLLVCTAQPGWMAAFGALLCVQHARLVQRGLTTNEALCWRKYSYLQKWPALDPGRAILTPRLEPPPGRFRNPFHRRGASPWPTLLRQLGQWRWLLVTALANAVASGVALVGGLRAVLEGVAAARALAPLRRWCVGMTAQLANRLRGCIGGVKAKDDSTERGGPGAPADTLVSPQRTAATDHTPRPRPPNAGAV